MNDAMKIWRAGVAAVQSEMLVKQHVRVASGQLMIGSQTFPLDSLSRIIVVGAGKAGAGMALGLEDALGPELLQEKQVTGWVNVPQDCLCDTRAIHLHAARPAGVNEPTAEGALGSEKILQLVQEADDSTLCIALISGGGSALMPAPIAGITLQQKLEITQFLSGAGANIEQLNTVRKQLSRLKGQGLARACRAGQLVTLIISDVMGDPLDVIASGPTVPNSTSVTDALNVLQHFRAETSLVGPEVIARLKALEPSTAQSPTVHPTVSNLVIGSNAVSVDAAVSCARELGYHTESHVASQSEGLADDLGRHLFEQARQMHQRPGKHCLVSGGEPTVQLIDAAQRGRGGRNQQVTLAALVTAIDQANGDTSRLLDGITILSGGTDGEDGPTDAAGAWVDAQIAARVIDKQLDPVDHLRTNNAYPFFEQVGALIKTGPTHTNVCDIRIVLTDSSG